jgi:glyoxylase-like metal-dependent hydrolase (beta-lactamase superfamily II)
MRIDTLFAHNPSAWTGAGNHTYLVTSAGDALLVDAGTGHEAHLSALEAALRTPVHDEPPATLSRVVVTHGHSDHASGVAALAARHPDTAFAKHPWPARDATFAVRWQTLADGDVLRVGEVELHVVHTPGHAPDHVCLFEARSGVLFGGDLVVAGSSVAILASAGGSLVEYLASLRRVLALAPRRILPAHGAPIDDPPRLLEGYIAHRLAREAQILEALDFGPRSVEDLVAAIYPALDPPLRSAAAESVLAHLVKLRDEGRVAAAGEGGVVRWRLR